MLVVAAMSMLVLAVANGMAPTCRCFCARAAPPYASEITSTTCTVADCMSALACPHADAMLINATWPFHSDITVYVATPAPGNAPSWNGTFGDGDAVDLSAITPYMFAWHWGMHGSATSVGAQPAGRTYAAFTLRGRQAVLLYPSSRYGPARLIDPTSPATHTFVLSQRFLWQPRHTAIVASIAVVFSTLLLVVGGLAWRKRSLIDAVVVMRIVTGPLALALALGALLATLAVCFLLALNMGHISLDYGFPPISATGVRLPEHFYFVSGFVCVSLLLGCAQFTFACVALATRPERRTLVLAHFALGFVQCPALILMAVLDSWTTEVAHFVFAVAGLFALICYEAMHIWVDRAVFEHRWWRKACWVWYGVTSAATLGGVVGWFSGCMECQWGAVGAIFLHFVPWFALLMPRPKMHAYEELVQH